MRTSIGLLVVGLALLSAACGADGPSVDKSGVAEKGVPGSAGNIPGTKKFPGKVCDLLKASEVEAVVKLGQPLTPAEGGGGSEERSCNYIFGGVAPALAVVLQGELEPVDWAGIKSVAGSMKVDVRGADAQWVPMTNTLHVHKNGLAVVLLLVTPAAGETHQVTVSKFAQPVADRLP